LKLLECFGFFQWTHEGRRSLLSDIKTLVDTGSVSREDGS
jgi:hypothetical protein